MKYNFNVERMVSGSAQIVIEEGSLTLKITPPEDFKNTENPLHTIPLGKIPIRTRPGQIHIVLLDFLETGVPERGQLVFEIFVGVKRHGRQNSHSVSQALYDALTTYSPQPYNP